MDAATALYARAWSQGDVGLLDAIMAPDHVQNDAVWQPAAADAGAQSNQGRERMRRGIAGYRRAYPDVRFEVLEAAAVRAPGPRLWRVFVHWRAAGTNLGPIRNQPPTGKRAEFGGVTVATVLVDSALSAQLLRSDVYRQAPADEAAYFLARGVVAPGGGSDAGGSGGGGAPD